MESTLKQSLKDNSVFITGLILPQGKAPKRHLITATMSTLPLLLLKLNHTNLNNHTSELFKSIFYYNEVHTMGNEMDQLCKKQ